jgi:hypothetical protein
VSTAQSSDQSASPLVFAVPYAIGVLVQLPLLISYLVDLSNRPHYSIYLIGILATIAVALIQWPWGQENIHRATIKSTMFAVMAVMMGVLGAVFGEAWFTACSVVLLIASYLSATVHRDGLHSVGYAVLPLVAFIRPPLNWDLGINARLQEYSAELASRFMSIASPVLVHIRTDSAFDFPGRDSFPLLNSLIGIGSVFSLIFIALIYVAVTRRKLFQTVLLVLSCFLWAVILNTVFLMLLPVFNYFLEMELASGSVNHNMIRVFLLLGTGLMIFSTGEFLNFAFSPVDPEIGRSYDFGRFITAVWNNFLAGRPFINETGQIVGRPPATITSHAPTMPLRWGMAGLLLVASVMPLISAGSFESVSASDIVTLTRKDMPESIDDWASVSSKFETHTFPGSGIQGFEKETWVYQSPDLSAKASIAEPFNMWMELPGKFHIQRWETKQRQVFAPSDTSDPWLYVVSDLTHETGENVRILFCHFDAAGQPVPPPPNGSVGGQLATARQSVQAPLFQVSLVHSHFNELTAETDEALTILFMKFRQAAMARVLRGATAAGPDDRSTLTAN